MKVVIIAAIGKENELGKDNQLLWHLQEDMQFFKRTTTNHYVLMGRKSFESIPARYRPLPNRVNIIISRDPEYMYEECFTCTSLEEGIELARDNGEDKLFIIGGGEIYRQAMEKNLVDEMYLTHVEASFPDAQVYFPRYEISKWEKEILHNFSPDTLNQYSFQIAHYSKKSQSEI